MARKIMGYLRKYQKRGYYIDPRDPIIDQDFQVVTAKEDFGGQYSYFREELDPRFPTPKLLELAISVFVDADHAHDKVTGRSITGLLSVVGRTRLHGARNVKLLSKHLLLAPSLPL